MARNIEFSRRPAQSGSTPSTPILRISRGQAYAGTVLSDDVTGAELHWIGRSVPHTEPAESCEGCQKGREIKWEGYLSVWSPRSNAFHILPLNPTAAAQCEAYIADHGTLRGAAITASRASAKNNAAVQVTLTKGATAVMHLPAAVDVVNVMLHVWGLTREQGLSIIRDVFHASRSDAGVSVPFTEPASDDQAEQINRMHRAYGLNGSHA